MRTNVLLTVLAALVAAVPAAAQAPKLGELQIKAYQKIPKTKTAVQLSSDSALARNLRREVMIRLAQRGNEVGFSGGNVMRMDVSYFDLSGSSSGSSGVITGSPSYEAPGSNPRQDLPRNRLERRDSIGIPPAGPTLRITLTLYSVDGGKVLWIATGSCITQGYNAEQAGISMIDNIFANADNNRIGDAGCPL
jgi:hypothetical protein